MDERTHTILHLCFHGIGRPDRPFEDGEEEYWVGRDSFLRWLDAAERWPDLRLSFDDGNRSDVDIALPALEERGLVADFHVLAGRLDHPASLSAQDVTLLRDRGMGIGVHGAEHVNWRTLDATSSSRELQWARTELETIVGSRLTRAAVPFGDYDRRALKRLRAAGYSTVYTSDRRPAEAESWLQPRFSVRRQDTPEAVFTEMYEAGLPTRVRRALVGVLKRLR